MLLPVKKLDPNATLPTRATEHSAGLDLYATADVGIASGWRVTVPTGISVAIPHGCVGKLHIRSGHARKLGLSLVNGVGVIDADYRGELLAVIENRGQTPQMIKAGERFAQLVITEYVHTDVIEVDDLEETVRSGGGFGSTGI
jgi:dUTP pyrophosphatase